MEDQMRSEAFVRLKPLCVQLTKEHTRTNVSTLFTAVQSINVNILADLQEYVLFPLRIILKVQKKCSQELYLDVYTCMEYVVGHTRMTHWDMFHDIFSTATTMLSCPSDHSKVARLSEELKLAIIQTLRTLVKSTEHSVLQRLYTIPSIPLLGHAVSLLINIAEREKARNLRILAMECLLDLSQADTKYSHCVKADIGNVFASFLPGVSMTLCKIMTGDSKQGYAVTTKAVYVWMRIVSLVMDDKLLDVASQKQAKQAEHSTEDPRLKGLLVERNSEWVCNTGSNLSILMKQVGSIRGHSNWRVRLGLVECAEHLLLHCTMSLRESVPTFLEILVGLIADDYSRVAAESHRALELFNQSQATEQLRCLVEILEENLHKLTTSLPRQIRTASEEDKFSILKLFAGYLSLLGSKVKTMLLSLPHLKRLSLALVQVLELECDDIKIVEERTNITGHGVSILSEGGNSSHSIVQPPKHFKHFHDEKVFKQLQTICRLLGYFGDINLLVDHFLDMFHESSIYRMQVTLILNEIMLGTTGDNVCVALSKEGVNWHKHSIEELESIVRLLVDEYLSPRNFNLVTSVTKLQREVEQSVEERLQSLTFSDQSTKTVSKLNQNIVQISLYLEGIGYFSKVLGRDFNPLLMSVLYPLLDKLGNHSAYISSSAFLSLCDICQSCKYKSLDEMIRENADYLMNSISMRLRHFQHNRQTPLVLKVMLQYSSAELLPLVDGIIQEILSSLDDHYEDEAVLFMGVLQELAKAVVRWFPEDKQESNLKSSTTVTSSDLPAEKITREGVLEYIKNYVKLKQLATGEVTPTDMEDLDPEDTSTTDRPVQEKDKDGEEEEAGGVDTKKKLPIHVAAVQEILTRSKHMLSSHNPRLRLLVLDIVCQSCVALQQQQDVLLPLVHELWPTFVSRFSDEEKLVTIRAIDTLLVMSSTTEDFIQRRVTKDVLPKLQGFLHKQAEISQQSGTGYSFTVNYKLQLAALNCLGKLAKNVLLFEADLDKLASACVVYLSCKQAQGLQKIGMECCQSLIELNPDLMWLKLVELYCPVAYTPPQRGDFKQIQGLSEQKHSNEYTSNVSKLLKDNLLL